MQIKDLAKICLGGYDNSVSIERPITPDILNEILFTNDHFELSLLPIEINELELTWFSVNTANGNLRADIVIYVK